MPLSVFESLVARGQKSSQDAQEAMKGSGNIILMRFYECVSSFRWKLPRQGDFISSDLIWKHIQEVGKRVYDLLARSCGSQGTARGCCATAACSSACFLTFVRIRFVGLGEACRQAISLS